MNSLKIFAAAATMSFAALATPASATPLLFDFSSLVGPSSDFSFIIDSSPAVTNASGDGFDVEDVDLTFGASHYDQTITFYTTSDFGGLFSSGFFDLYGPQVFTDPTSAPAFAPGTFELANAAGAEAGTLTISTAAVPEPATWAMMILGFGAVGIAMRRSKKVLATA